MRRSYPMLDEGNTNLPIFWIPRCRPIKLSTSVPIKLRKLAWRIRKFPVLAAKAGYFLILPSGYSTADAPGSPYARLKLRSANWSVTREGDVVTAEYQG